MTSTELSSLSVVALPLLHLRMNELSEIRRIVFIFLLLIELSVTVVDKSLLKLCHSIIPSVFSNHQKQLLCSFNDSNASLYPALCSFTTKELLPRLSSKEVVSLCIDNLSKETLKCLQYLDNDLRQKYGYQLCSSRNYPHNNSENPISLCFNSILRLPNINHDEAVDYCYRTRNSVSSVDCIKVLTMQYSLPVSQALSYCKNVISITNSTTDCLSDMRFMIKSYSSLKLTDIISFCNTARPEYYQSILNHQSIQQDSKHDLLEFNSSLVNCYSNGVRLISKMNSVGLKFSTIQILELCENSPVTLGPIHCVNNLLSRRDHSLSTMSTIKLCKYAINESPSVCYGASNGLGDTNKRVEICSQSLSSVNSRLYQYCLG